MPKSLSDGSPDHDAENAGTPRWVKAFGIIVLVLVLVFAVVHLTMGGLGGLHSR